MTKRQNQDLDGNVPDKAPSALLIIDVFNRFDFSGGDELVRLSLPMAKHISALKRRMKEAGQPSIYVNDNFGRWRSDFRRQVEECRKPDAKGRDIADLLVPDEDDYYVLKPRHSGFYSTTLDVLLEYLGTHTLVITGLVSHICVLFTANDAYQRGYHLVIPRDAVISSPEKLHRAALEQMEQVLKAEIVDSSDLEIARLMHRRSRR